MEFNYVKLKELRKLKNLTVEDVAEKVGATKSAVYNWQSGRNMPDSETLDKLAALFSVKKEDLLYLEQKPTNNIWENEAYNLLKSENNYLKQMIAFLTDGKVKDELVKLKGNLTTAGEQCKVIAFGASKVTPLANVG